MDLMTEAPSWKMALANASCSSIQLALVWTATGVSNTTQIAAPTSLPAAVKIETDTQIRTFEIPIDAKITQNTNGEYGTNVALSMDPLLQLTNGTHPVQAWLYSDEAATVQITAGKLAAVPFTGCQANSTLATTTSSAISSAITGTAISEETTSVSEMPATTTSHVASFSLDNQAQTAVPTATQALSSEDKNKKVINSGISVGVLAFALLCVIMAIVYRQRQRAVRRRLERRQAMNDGWMETGEI
jgi:hypothetical protein